MPYFITDESADCSGWATIKDDGEVMGCHQTKQDAIDQMVALSIEEGIEPGGERSARDLPEAYRPALSPDVPEGRACGNCIHYDENDTLGDMAWCHQWEEYVRGDYYCDRWAPVQIGGRATDWPDVADVAHFDQTVALDQPNRERTADMAEHDTRRPVDDIVRHVEFRAAKNDDGLTLDGYGAVFDQWTEITDYMGSYRERIAPGAFKRTLGQRMPVLQFDHGTHPLIGSIPLGRISSISEDAHGLRVKARLSDNWLVQPVRDAIRDGGITGMSFRFRIIGEQWAKSRNDGMDERTISEVELYEVGPVVFPAYEQTSVGVRSRQALSLLQDPEVRGEIARIMATGTDIESLAASDDPADGHSSDLVTPADSHVPIPTRSQRVARLRLAGIIKE